MPQRPVSGEGNGVKGKLAALIGGEAYAESGGINGSGRGTRTPDTRIMIPLL